MHRDNVQKYANIQQKAVDSLLKFGDQSRVTCNMFCGTGKSYVMMKYLEIWLQKHSTATVLFLTPSIEVLNQLQVILKMQLTGIKIFQIADYVGLSDHNNQNQPHIVFGTYCSSFRLKNLQFDLAFYDEAHRSTAPKFSQTLYDDFVRITKRIFFTATIKHYKINTSEYANMSDEKLYGKTVFRYTYCDAIRDNLIVPLQLYCSNNSHNYVQIVAKYLLQHSQCKILTYHNTNQNAAEFARLLNQALSHSIYVDNISGLMPKHQRTSIFKKFTESSSGCLCSSRLLGEGVNLNCVDTIFFVDSRHSEIDIIQCLGRGVRQWPGKSFCNVIVPMDYQSRPVPSQVSICNLIELLKNDGYAYSTYNNHRVVSLYLSPFPTHPKNVIWCNLRCENESNLNISLNNIEVSKIVKNRAYLDVSNHRWLVSLMQDYESWLTSYNADFSSTICSNLEYGRYDSVLLKCHSNSNILCIHYESLILRVGSVWFNARQHQFGIHLTLLDLVPQHSTEDNIFQNEKIFTERISNQILC